jgi:hypothetical protein
MVPRHYTDHEVGAARGDFSGADDSFDPEPSGAEPRVMCRVVGRRARIETAGVA